MAAEVIRSDMIGGGPVEAAARVRPHSEVVLATVIGLDSGAIARLPDSGVVA